MMLSRRSMLYGAAATLGAGQLRWTLPRGTSGLVTGKPVPLKYKAVDGFLSAEQIRWHHESHYAGALKTFVELEAKVVGDHKTRIAKANSTVLHELYFDTMTAAPPDPTADAAETLKKRFGSLDKWLDDFRAAALSCEGWAVLAYHPVNGRLYNIASDAHDEGPAWFGVPLVVCDMYEHAYYLDFQNRRADYVGGFAAHLDWNEIDARLKATSK